MQGVIEIESAAHFPDWLYAQFSAAQQTSRESLGVLQPIEFIALPDVLHSKESQQVCSQSEAAGPSTLISALQHLPG